MVFKALYKTREKVQKVRGYNGKTAVLNMNV